MNASAITARTRVLLGLVLWLALTLVLGASGVLTIERRPLVPLAIASSTIALVLLARRRGALATVAQSIDVRVLILFHAIRAPIGAGFLVLGADGRLDPLFAEVAGWGDIAVGITAVIAAMGGARPVASWTRVRLLWNALGLADILVVLAIAQSILLGSDHPQTMAGLLVMPWPVIPLWVVPLVLATHALSFARLRADAAAPVHAERVRAPA
ncbi:MAG: hypothetical protein IPK74_32115 [Deltaproteobacteria bacterium]|nr:hypothetical protein [Deltaproteobacteria bacterium]